MEAGEGGHPPSVTFTCSLTFTLPADPRTSKHISRLTFTQKHSDLRPLKTSGSFTLLYKQRSRPLLVIGRTAGWRNRVHRLSTVCVRLPKSDFERTKGRSWPIRAQVQTSSWVTWRLSPASNVWTGKNSSAWLDACCQGVGLHAPRLAGVLGLQSSVPLRAPCWALGPPPSPRTLYGSRSRPAGGGTLPGRHGTAAHPPPPARGIELATHWQVAAAVGLAGSRTARTAGWRRMARWDWSGNGDLQDAIGRLPVRARLMKQQIVAVTMMSWWCHDDVTPLSRMFCSLNILF